MNYVFAMASIVCFYYGIDALNQHYKTEVVPTNLSTIIYAIMLFVWMNI